MGWRQFALALGYAKNLGETQLVNTDEMNSLQIKVMGVKAW